MAWNDNRERVEQIRSAIDLASRNVAVAQSEEIHGDDVAAVQMYQKAAKLLAEATELAQGAEACAALRLLPQV